MVFFTCSQCGESIKKPAVAKHYQIKCRSRPYMTCVDCLKDFTESQIEAHTKCVTEEERYSAKGFVAKPSSNKGEKKQQAWNECIQTVLDSHDLKSDERDLLQKLVKHENIPRKKAKFINFLKNAYRNYAHQGNLIDRIWVRMETIFFAMSSQQENNKKENDQNDKPAQGAPSSAPLKRSHSPSDSQDNLPKKKSKKSKHKETKKHADTEADDNDLEEKNETKLEATDTVVEEKSSKVKKEKRKHKNKNKSDDNAQEQLAEMNGDKKDMTKQKVLHELTTNGKDNSLTGDEKLEKFPWKQVILEIAVAKTQHQPISVKKLKKKVLKRYYKIMECEATDKMSKKFDKKLSKIQNVSIEGDHVIIKS